MSVCSIAVFEMISMRLRYCSWNALATDMNRQSDQLQRNYFRHHYSAAGRKFSFYKQIDWSTLMISHWFNSPNHKRKVVMKWMRKKEVTVVFLTSLHFLKEIFSLGQIRRGYINTMTKGDKKSLKSFFCASCFWFLVAKMRTEISNSANYSYYISFCLFNVILFLFVRMLNRNERLEYLLRRLSFDVKF